MIATLALVALLARPAAAVQSPFTGTSHPIVVTGRIRRGTGKDTVAVGPLRAVLHRVATDSQGPIDSVMTDAQGRFTFHFDADTGVVYLVSARWDGVEYFAVPLVTQPPAHDVTTTLVVADTSSRAVVTVAARHIIVSAPGAGGARDVLDLIVLENAGGMTRVAADSTHPTFMLALPAYIANLQLGEGDFAADALERAGDTLALFAPVPPGERNLVLDYQIPPDNPHFVIPITHPIPAVNVLLEEPAARVVGLLTRADSAVVDQQRSFSRWTGALQAGQPLVLSLPDHPGAAPWLLPMLVGALALGLIGVLALTQRPAHAPATEPMPPAGYAPEPDPGAAAIIDRIAMLDEVHAAGATAFTPEAWSAYVAERAALKEQLRRLLPG